MSAAKVIYAKDALKDLRKIPKKAAIRIIEKIAFFSQQKDVLHFAKPLVGFEQEYFRFRIGDYRAIFTYDKKNKIKILFVLRIKHRKDVYK